MEITNIKVRPVEGMPRLKAYASIVLDNQLAINDMMVIQTDHGLCVEFPKTKRIKKAGWELVAPLNRKTRYGMQTQILEAYRSTTENKIA